MLVKTGPAAITQSIKHPELLACLRMWHVGHAQRDKMGEKIMLPWRTIELEHNDSHTTICTIDVGGDEDDDTLGATIEHKVEMFCKPRARGETQIVDVVCHFNDGTYAYSERCTIDIDLPPNKPVWGNTSYAGMGKDLSSPQTQQAVMLKANIDMHHASMGMLKESMGMVRETMNVLRGENSDFRAHQNEMLTGQVEMIKAFREVMNWKVDEEIKREMAKYKIWALHAAFEKVLKWGTPLVAKVTKAVSHRIAGTDPNKPVPPRERRALGVLKDLIADMQASGAVKDPGVLFQMLKSAGADETTVGRLMEIIQEIEIEGMTEEAEKEAAQGLGSIFDADGNLQIPALQSSFAQAGTSTKVA